MDRSEFIRGVLTAAGAAAASTLLPDMGAAGSAPTPCSDLLSRAESESRFVANWLDDLLEAAEQQLTTEQRTRLIEHCGRKCFLRHSFKTELAKKGAGSVDKLIAAYRENFEAWREGDLVHIRYGEVSKGCYCPAARLRPPRPGDLHCECTRATHQAVFETALGGHFKLETLATVRRGGKTCHFLVHLDG